ncbi:MAG: hypothetical protein MH204_11510 [Fimbriimonadaceae bacterium]|nr:hypothetical protein [Fimbriimonadaceae bacterium]
MSGRRTQGFAAGAVLLGVSGLAAGLLALRSPDGGLPGFLNQTSRPEAFRFQDASPPLQAATKRYFQRGGKYIWGRNDCSKFILDYLKARGSRVSMRHTTASLLWPGTMPGLGYGPAGAAPEEGEEQIWVFRYRGDDGGPAGHTGIALGLGGRTVYIHNVSREGGLIWEEEDDFRARVKEQGVDFSRVRFFEPIR